ncbi:MAG: proline--tRNA ligase [Coriobacteriaceae bacterium]|nr:proline--tRNA ligase [Coriobacteriaceae bacterium]
MRLSSYYVPTLKEDPADAEIASHRLLIRAGMIRKTASGVYTFLPLGKKVLAKIEHIVRQEMDAIGALEISMPALQPAELWHESGRWEVYGPELMRLTDRHERPFCLGPTHEELITALIRNELRSYKELPLSLYQIQTKYRDEVRPRFGLLRGREFIMKDAYSFHASQASLQKTYDEMSGAYGRICDRLGLEWRAVEADSGQIGGKTSCEFMALAQAGEAELVYCTCGYAANTEAGEGKAKAGAYEEAQGLEKLATPGIHTIAALAEFLGIPESSTVKAMAAKGSDSVVTVFFLPGDHELNELKAARLVPGFTLLSDADMEALGLPKGSIGPVGLPQGVRVVADACLQDVGHWVVGANEEGHHFVGARPGTDFTVDLWADLITVKPKDSCLKCGGELEGARGIEVSQVFQLGEKYSRAMGASFSAEDGTDQPFIMGCYGLGVTRSMAAIVEQYHDEKGILWPMTVAPAQVCVIPLETGDDLVQPTAEKLAHELVEIGLEVAIDDRDERAGVKFNDADLIGWPLQVIVGKRGLADSKVEVKLRHTGAKKEVSLDAVAEMLRFIKRGMKGAKPSYEGFFG